MDRTASRVAVGRAAEALGAELATLLRRGEVVASMDGLRLVQKPFDAQTCWAPSEAPWTPSGC
jgi:hypothetical protein